MPRISVKNKESMSYSVVHAKRRAQRVTNRVRCSAAGSRQRCVGECEFRFVLFYISKDSRTLLDNRF